MKDTLGIDIDIPQKSKSCKIQDMFFNASFFLINWITCVKLTQNTILLLSSLMLSKGLQALFDKDIHVASELIIYQNYLGLYNFLKINYQSFLL